MNFTLSDESDEHYFNDSYDLVVNKETGKIEDLFVIMGSCDEILDKENLYDLNSKEVQDINFTYELKELSNYISRELHKVRIDELNQVDKDELFKLLKSIRNYF